MSKFTEPSLLAASVLPQLGRESREERILGALAAQVLAHDAVLEPELVEASVSDRLTHAADLLDESARKRRGEPHINSRTQLLARRVDHYPLNLIRMPIIYPGRNS